HVTSTHLAASLRLKNIRFTPFFRLKYLTFASNSAHTMTFNESKIEIAAPPAKVREILLNFSAYPEWHTEWIKSIEIQENEKTGKSLITGDKVQVNIEGFKFIADVVENTDTLFSWQGPPVFTIAGLHKFHIEPTEDGAGTIFTQSETSKGFLSFLLSPSVLGKKLRADYEVFNRDLKARAEAST
ncbi:uncharacterized protein N7484_000837, partial [Penicillium longicatenatum]|uniref:uncharacterized protein n=1 Tax=Penicillium longicatenatum TaxID=1561947 RepID=UPI002548751A